MASKEDVDVVMFSWTWVCRSGWWESASALIFLLKLVAFFSLEQPDMLSYLNFTDLLFERFGRGFYPPLAQALFL